MTISFFKTFIFIIIFSMINTFSIGNLSADEVFEINNYPSLKHSGKTDMFAANMHSSDSSLIHVHNRFHQEISSKPSFEQKGFSAQGLDLYYVSSYDTSWVIKIRKNKAHIGFNYSF